MSLSDIFEQFDKLFKRLSDIQPIELMTEEEIIAIHDEVINIYGGRPGIRDRNLITSGPKDFKISNCELYDYAVFYLLHYAGGHPFVDGNKRTGVAVALEFLSQNGVEWRGDMVILEGIVRKISRESHYISDPGFQSVILEDFLNATRV
jgi:death on curing protein